MSFSELLHSGQKGHKFDDSTWYRDCGCQSRDDSMHRVGPCGCPHWNCSRPLSYFGSEYSTSSHSLSRGQRNRRLCVYRTHQLPGSIGLNSASYTSIACSSRQARHPTWNLKQPYGTSDNESEDKKIPAKTMASKINKFQICSSRVAFCRRPLFPWVGIQKEGARLVKIAHTTEGKKINLTVVSLQHIRPASSNAIHKVWPALSARTCKRSPPMCLEPRRQKWKRLTRW